MSNTFSPPRPGQAKQENAYDPTFGGKVILTRNPKVKIVSPSATNMLKGRILPSFDWEIPRIDTTFKTGTLPYRDSSVRDEETNHCVWNAWYYDNLPIYRFWGKDQRSFISPKLLYTLGTSKGKESFDPVAKINWMIYKDDRYKKYAELTKPIPMGSTATKNPLERSKQMAIFNFFGTFGEQESPENYLVLLTSGGMDFITTQLNKFKGPNPPFVDKNWPDYMLGDITDVETGLVGWSEQKSLGNAGHAANTLCFSRKDDFLASPQFMPVDEEVLKGRHNFFDTDNVLYIPEPYEIVEYLLDDSRVPIDLIKEACEGMVNVPDAPTKQNYTPPKTESTPQADKVPWKPVEEEKDDIPMFHPPQDVKPAQTPSEAPKTPSPLTTEEQIEYAELEAKMADKSLFSKPDQMAKYFGYKQKVETAKNA